MASYKNKNLCDWTFMTMKRNILVLLLSVSAVGLWACGGQTQTSENQQDGYGGGQGSTFNSSEDLLAAEGSFSMVEAGSHSNPLQEHLQARVQVDPSQPSKSKNYTSSASESTVSEEAHFRVLRLESEVASLQSDFKKMLPAKSNLIVSDKKLDATIDQIELRQASSDQVQRSPVVASAPTTDDPAPVPGPGPQKPIVIAQNNAPNNAPAGAITEVPPRKPAQYGDQARDQAFAQPATGGQLPDVSDRTATYSAAQTPVSAQRAPAQQAQPSKMAAMAVSDARPAPSQASGGVVISRVRTGEHPGKTRMVFDVSGPSNFKFDVDNAEKRLMLDVSSAAWGAPEQNAVTNSSLISGYTAHASSQNQGTSVEIALKKPVRVLYSAAMKPNEVHGHRIVLDIAAE
jgi:hypothetical protein